MLVELSKLLAFIEEKKITEMFVIAKSDNIEVSLKITNESLNELIKCTNKGQTPNDQELKAEVEIAYHVLLIKSIDLYSKPKQNTVK